MIFLRGIHFPVSVVTVFSLSLVGTFSFEAGSFADDRRRPAPAGFAGDLWDGTVVAARTECVGAVEEACAQSGFGVEGTTHTDGVLEARHYPM
jgi:hypothetical protein